MSLDGGLLNEIDVLFTNVTLQILPGSTMDLVWCNVRVLDINVEGTFENVPCERLK